MGDSSATGGSLSSDPVQNKQFGDRYDVLERLGDGPLVVAFRGRDRTLNRLVSVKTLQPAFSQNPAVRDRLRNGLGRTLALSSPRIVRAYDVGTIDFEGKSILYWVEEYVRGINLKERIRRTGPFPVAAAIDAAIALAEALEYAHSRGIPHGDLRPQNVLIGPEGEMKLTGFGIADAQAVAIQSEPEQSRRIGSYTAPELPVDSPASAQADLYALGAILFELLTGELPLGVSGQGRSLRSQHGPFVFPAATEIDPIPRAIRGIVEKATMIRPDARYETSSAILIDLRSARDGLRYGKALNWSPLDGHASPVAEANETGFASTAGQAGATARMPPGGSSSTERGPTIGSDPMIAMPKATPQRPSRPLSELRFVGEAPSAHPDKFGERSSVARGKPIGDDDEKDGSPLRRDNQQGDDAGGSGNRYLTSLNLFLLVLVVAGLGILGYMTASFLKPSPEVVVPNLVGRTVTDAKEMASEQKFDLAVVDEQYRENDPAGVIYQMQPPPGRHIREGKPISISVSKGPRMVDVPDVRSTTLEKARQTLDNNNLKLGDYTFQYDPVEPKGNVLSQDPQPGESRPHGTKIALVLSKGEEPPPTPVPDVPAPPVTNTPDPTPPPVDTPGDHPATPSPAVDQSDLDSRVRTFDIKYPVPADGAAHRIRIDVTDRDGTRTVFDETHKAGDSIKQQVTAVGKQIHIRLFDNDKLIAESVK